MSAQTRARRASGAVPGTATVPAVIDDDPAAARLEATVEARRRHAKLARMREAARDELRGAKDDRAAAESALSQARQDVSPYERHSLRAWLTRLLGRFDRERGERRRTLKLATARHDGATARVAAVSADVDALTADIDAIGTKAAVEAEYVAAFAARERSLAAGPRGAEITAASARHVELVADGRELDEAISAGKSASAALARFRRELADVDLSLEISDTVDLGSFPWFADFLFDGLFDFTNQRRIANARYTVDETTEHVDQLVNALQVRRRKVAAEAVMAEELRRKLVEGPRAG